MYNTEKLKKDQMAAIIKSCGVLEKNVSAIKMIAESLNKFSDAIIEHTAHGDLGNQEHNRQLWHGLNNVEHQLNQFARYTEASMQDFVTASGQLIEKLRSFRPPKD